jgi:hypothetical protein
MDRDRDRSIATRRLLQAAALGEGEAAVAAWTSWRQLTRPWQLVPASDWWFPLVWWNLRGAPLAEADRSWLRRMYDDAWIRNQHLLAVAGDAVAALERDGIDTLVLKGAALALTVYERAGLRPFGDVDVLVRPDAAEKARTVLAARGWTPIRHVAADSLDLRHSLGFTNSHGVDFDLHWASLSEGGGDHDGDRRFWQRAVPLALPGVTSRSLAPPDQLLHVLVHGLRWSPVPTDHWRADAIMLMRRGGEALRWDVLEQEARDRRLMLQIRSGLEQLHDDYGAPIPSGVIAHLRRERAAWWERVEYRAKRRRPTIGPLVLQSWCQAARRREHLHVGGVAANVRAMAGVEDWRGLLSTGVARAFGSDALPDSRTIRAYGRTIRIDAARGDGRLIDAVLQRLPRFEPIIAAEPDRCYTIARQPSAAGAAAHFRISVNYGVLAAAPDLDTAAQAVAVDLQTFLVAAASDVTFVHAGVVGVGGRAVILPGASRAGKSTLVAALLRAGATYLSDEYAVVRSDGRVEPFARPLVLRNQEGERVVDPTAFGARTADAPLPAGVVLFAHFAPGGAFSPIRISGATAVFKLLSHSPGAQATPIETIARLRALAAAPAWTTARGEADETAAALISAGVDLFCGLRVLGDERVIRPR